MKNWKNISDNTYKGKIKGPVNPFVKGNIPLEITFKLEVDRKSQTASVEIGKETYKLEMGKISDWVKLEF